jgi:hypothetical protein
MLTAQNVSIDDYQVPISKARTLRFDGSWNWSQSGSIVKSNNADANVLYKTFYSSLPLAWFLNVDASGGKSFGDYNHNLKADFSFRKYIWQNTDWFGFAKVTAQHANFYKQIASDFTVGFGFGRYIRATSLAKAVRIEEHLIKDNILNSNLPKETMIHIANIIERENEYIDLYGTTYETQWFQDIEYEISTTDAANENTIGSLGILRMRQVLFGINEKVNERYYGWDASAGILFPITTFNKKKIGKPNLSFSGRYSVPFTWQTQINWASEIFTPLDSSFMQQIQLRSGIDFIYELSNRINFVAGYRIGIIKPEHIVATIEHNLNSSFWYYIENNIYFTISASFTKQGNNPRLISSRIGLQYNLF